MKATFLYMFVCLSCLKGQTFAWGSDDFEIFDIVEEVNQNFYELLNIKPDASSLEVKRAFRTLTIALHPDKNSAEDANIQFRNLVSVYEVLKDPSKREKYDLVLKNGLPNWKSAMYYYRRVHKMGLAEMAALLFTILTVGQYIIAWAAYVEKKYTAESLLGPKMKKLQRKNCNVDMDTILNSIPTPSLLNLLPFQIVRGIWHTPAAILGLFRSYSEYKKIQEEEKRIELEELEKQKLLEEEFIKQKEARKEGARNRKPVFKVQEKSEEELKGYSKLNLQEDTGTAIKAAKSKEQVISGGLWTDEDLTELIRLVKKYPIGTLSRWETIASYMNRSVQEVTFMAAKMKDTGYRVNAELESVAETIVQQATKKTKKTAADPPKATAKNVENLWSQEQQKLLENSIVTYTKSTVGDRWQKIANAVPGKTKEECLARYKYLVEIVKAQKAAENAAQLTGTEVNSTENVNTEEAVADEVPTNREEAPVEEPIALKKEGGKPRNKRKERKKQITLSSDEDELYDE